MLTGITVEAESIKIPLGLLTDSEDEGLAVLTLAEGAYLIMRSDVLAAYPRRRLAEISSRVRALQITCPPHQIAERVSASPRKQRALETLWQQGYSVSDGSDYGLEELLIRGVTLEQVHKGLASMQGSLSQEVSDERDER